MDNHWQDLNVQMGVSEEAMAEWVKQCDCCTECFNVPCDGVMAGGLCDNFCVCGDILSEPPWCGHCGGTCECDD